MLMGRAEVHVAAEDPSAAHADLDAALERFRSKQHRVASAWRRSALERIAT